VVEALRAGASGPSCMTSSPGPARRSGW